MCVPTKEDSGIATATFMPISRKLVSVSKWQPLVINSPFEVQELSHQEPNTPVFRSFHAREAKADPKTQPMTEEVNHLQAVLFFYPIHRKKTKLPRRHCSWKVKITQTVQLGPFWKILWTENFIVIHRAMSFCQPYLQKYPESIRFSPSSLSSNPSYQNFWYKGCNKERNTGLPQWPPYWSPCSHTYLHTAITMIG